MPSNSITLCGTLTRNPERTYLPRSGSAAVQFGLMVYCGEPNFYNVIAFGDLADNITVSLVEGSRIVLTGRLAQRTFENRDGDKQTTYEIVADDIGASLLAARIDIYRNDGIEGKHMHLDTDPVVAALEVVLRLGSPDTATTWATALLANLGISTHTFAERLQLVRSAMGWTTEQAGDACKFGGEMWGRWESGEMPPSLEWTCLVISRRTGVSAPWLATGGGSA